MLVNFLKFLCNLAPVKKRKKVFLVLSNTILLLANVIDVAVIIVMAVYVNKVAVVIYAVMAAMIIRVGRGEHYQTWLECCVSGLLIYTLYAFASLLIQSVAVDLLLGFALAVYMIDFKGKP